eukprot:TRINITY_DN1977_c0_g1_i1.p1 TRINITY_DN1977_c0_g1~~TRINITY_DN1977_c0_g1_i1.p1  ORF type:complete len:355 (+),score=86.71 TRINITY_DN1977_c0_g1_i1:155-1219(+)
MLKISTLRFGSLEKQYDPDKEYPTKDLIPKNSEQAICHSDDFESKILSGNASRDDSVNTGQLVNSTIDGLKLYEPELTRSGIGGTYFMRDASSSIVSVFKPSDEEPGSLNNPKNSISPKSGTKPGEGTSREVAAYLLDHESRACVPETVATEFMFWRGKEERKCGSLQAYVKNVGESWDMSSSRFSVEDVHNIAQLDIRIFNMDRNGGNLLVTNPENIEGFKLVPIDHTYSLPDKLDGAWFEWMYWKQAKVPISDDLLRYIRDIDIEADSEILRKLEVREECINTMRYTTTILKIGAEMGITLFDIADIICRKKDQPSALETICIQMKGIEEEYWKQFEVYVSKYIFVNYVQNK